MIGQLVAHYQITAKIGAGGMGEVYRAKDTKLEREVAFKVLPAEMASDRTRLSRFQREARTVAALNHPNIVTIFSVEEADGVHFLTMELVTGKAIDEFLPSNGFPLDRLLALATPITDAVASAHARGVVHRDLKPANVMVTDEGNRVKVLDFGLAKLTAADGVDGASQMMTMTETQDGLIMGTPHYMSPEQARGEAVDHRSDIFSLGVMLFEMAAGRRPFEGKTAIELMSAVLKDPAPLLSDIRPRLPRHLGRVIERCLEKAPEDRYQTARDVYNELRALRRETRSVGAPRATAPAAPAVGAKPAPRRRMGGFVGRDTERTRLDEMLEKARQGHGSLVLLGGEPGVGKTRLATEVLEDGRERGMLALTGHAYEDETAPFIISAEILEEMVRLVPEDELRQMLGRNASELSRLLPELREIFPDVREPAELPPEMQQRQLFKSVLEFLVRGSAEQPMVMLFDDIHWADESSLLLLEHIAPRLAELPILMIGTYRDVEADIGKPFARSMATLVRQRLAERLAVNPFDEGSVASILAALGGSSPPTGLAHAIHEATEGNVFFIEETFRHLSEEGRLFDPTGAWRTDLDIEHLDVPEGVRLVTARRLERLTEPTRKVLSMASVIGLRFRIAVLEAAAPDGDAVLDALEEAEASQLLKPTEGGRDLRYEFVHALARQTLLSDLSPLRRQRMHLTIADALEQTAGGKPEGRAADIAYHLVEAGSSAGRETTIHWLKTAGESAFAAAAMGEACSYFDRALSLTDDSDHELRADLLHRRGTAQLSLGNSEQYEADLSEAFDVFEELGEAERSATIATELSYALLWKVQIEKANSLISRALALAGEEHPAQRALLDAALSYAASFAGDSAVAQPSITAARELADTLHRPEILVQVLHAQSQSVWHFHDGAQLETVSRLAEPIWRDLRREWNLAHCLWMLQVGLVWQGRFDEAELINDELHPLATRLEDHGSLGLSAIANAMIAQARGNVADSSSLFRESAAHFDAGGFPWGPYSYGHDSLNLLLAGNFECARTGFEEAAAHRLPPSAWSGNETHSLVSGKATLGDADAYEVFDSLRDQLPVAGKVPSIGAVQLLLGAIEAAVWMGRDDEAANLYPQIRDFVSSGVALLGGWSNGLAERFAGMAAAAARDWEAAEEHFETTLDLAETLPHRVDQARVRFWYGRSLLDRDGPGDRDRAHGLLNEARQLSESMGMHGLIQWVDDQLAR